MIAPEHPAIAGIAHSRVAGESWRFSKMHGAGNDFVLLDLRGGRRAPETDTLRRLADRHFGVGCDQVIGIADPMTAGSLAAYRIWNADGAPADQCGNGVRCVAAWLRRDGVTTARDFLLDSPSGTHAVRVHGESDFSVAMGVPAFAPARIPFAATRESAGYSLDIDGQVVRFGAVSMGNPHALIEVADIAAAPVRTLGPALQVRREFPQGVNVGFAQVMDAHRIALRVFERGVGETLACGSGACAAVAILARQQRVGRDVAVELPGGTLHVVWPEDAAQAMMRGPAEFVFEGVWVP